MSKEIIIQILSDRPVAYRPDFAKSIGSVQAGLFLSQLFYWCDKGSSEWIYKTRDEIYHETGISRYEQETARKKLKALGLLSEKIIGVPPKIHYKIDFDAVINLLESHQLTGGNAPNQLGETPPLNRGQNSLSSIAEITTEITSESTTLRGFHTSLYNLTKEIFHKGFMELNNGQQWSWGGRNAFKNAKQIKDLIEIALDDCKQDEAEAAKEIRRRSANLFKHIIKGSDKFLSSLTFTPDKVANFWNQLATYKVQLSKQEIEEKETWEMVNRVVKNAQ